MKQMYEAPEGQEMEMELQGMIAVSGPEGLGEGEY